MPDQHKDKVHVMTEADKAKNAAKEAKAAKAAERERLRAAKAEDGGRGHPRIHPVDRRGVAVSACGGHLRVARRRAAIPHPDRAQPGGWDRRGAAVALDAARVLRQAGAVPDPVRDAAVHGTGAGAQKKRWKTLKSKKAPAKKTKRDDAGVKWLGK
jgi:hypothetical protein